MPPCASVPDAATLCWVEAGIAWEVQLETEITESKTLLFGSMHHGHLLAHLHCFVGVSFNISSRCSSNNLDLIWSAFFTLFWWIDGLSNFRSILGGFWWEAAQCLCSLCYVPYTMTTYIYTSTGRYGGSENIHSSLRNQSLNYTGQHTSLFAEYEESPVTVQTSVKRTGILHLPS